MQLTNLEILAIICVTISFAVIWAGILHQRAKQGFRDMCAMKREDME